MRVSGDGDGDVHARRDGGPHEAGHALGPPAHDLHGEGDGVDVGTVVCDDAEGEDDEAEFAEAAERGEEYGGEQPARAGRRVAVHVAVVAVVERRGRHDGDAKEFGEEEGDHEADPDGAEDLLARLRDGLVHGVVGGVACPARGEAVDYAAKAQHAAELRGANAHGDIDKVARVRELAQHDEEDDEGRDPAPKFVCVHDLVAEEGYQEGAHGDDEDACPPWDVVVDGVDELRADDAVDGAPADAGEHIEEGDELDTPPAEPEAREDHLAEAKARAKGAEETDGDDAQHVEEEAGEDGVDEAEEEELLGEEADGEGGDDHVGGEPLGGVSCAP